VSFLVRKQRLESKFTHVYRKNLFEGTVSLSGNGSDLQQTRELAVALPKLIKTLNIHSILDVPCGDLYWMSKIDLEDTTYIGADIVRDVVVSNIHNYGNDLRAFIELDLSQQVPPKVDLVFCRDLFVHLTTKDIQSSLRNIAKSGSLYLATTTFSNNRKYRNLKRFTRGVGWRAINFEIEPWNFPKPLYLINEKCTEANGLWSDKSIGVWLISELLNKY
jgi:hypothetical protein